MAQAAPRPCRKFGCSALVRDGSGYCAGHQDQVRKVYDQRRGSSSKRGYGWRWSKERKQFLEDNPLCRSCKESGLIVAANEVDHIIPKRGGDPAFWDQTNWQPLCKTCHSRKTATQDGAFGHWGAQYRN